MGDRSPPEVSVRCRFDESRVSGQIPPAAGEDRGRPVATDVVIDERRFHERLLAQDPGVLSELYDQFSDSVYGVILRVTSDRGAADDITQSIFIDVWRRPDRWDPDRGALRPWLSTLAHHRSVDWLRREQAIRRRDTRALATRSDPPPDVEEAVQAVLVAERVRGALARLPEEQRSAISLAYFGGRTYRQVASDLGVAEGTVKSRIRAGLAHMAKTLHAELARPGQP
jgi:RNA polymerase sigma factor (sigma-70 family)